MNDPTSRAPLVIPKRPTDELDDFTPRTIQQPVLPAVKDTARKVDAVSQFPSRDPVQTGQMNLRGPTYILDRFKAMCKEDRRPYYDMLEVLMNAYEGKPQT